MSELLPFITAVSALGAGGVAVVIVWLLLPVIKGQQDIQSKMATAFNAQVGINKEMADGATKRDQQIDLMIKQIDLSLKAMDRNAMAAESQNSLLIDIKNETTASGNRTQNLHDAMVSGINDTSTAIGSMSEHVIDRIGKSEATLLDGLNLIPQKVLEVFEPARSEIVVKLDTLAPEVAKAIVPNIEDMFKNCVEMAQENSLLTKEIDRLRALVREHAEHVDDTQTRVAMLSMVDGAANRAIIDGDKPEPPTPGTKEPLPFEKPSDPVLGKTGTDL